ncbi:winged helix-turn-helix domain-containing protein [Actinophytocola sp.]|uniref:winged helix-turn-helix domain-containing protein n=1 Tax=Actinophytocola sp. TaxID=1872138 RepID=UPI002ED1DA2F
MLRIFFTSDDVARTRIAPGPDPLWELVMSLQLLRPQPGDLLFRPWREAVRQAVGRLGGRLRLLLSLTPPVGYFPDFLNPSAALGGLEHGLAAIRSTAKTALHHDVRHLASSSTLPAEAWRLASGEPSVLTDLTDTMLACYAQVVAPYQATVDAAVERDRRRRVEALATGGVEGLLASLEPVARWSCGELRLPGHRDQELHLDGRGLLLIPSYFCLKGPVTMLDPTLPPVVVYSVTKRPDLLTGRDTSALATLIGATRAALLEAVATGGPLTTTTLARRAGTAASTASEHATVLRDAGLIDSNRDRNRMVHQVTPLGRSLLDGH